jgi:signal transduction histidine kinase
VWVANTFGEIHSVSSPSPFSLPKIGDQVFSLACADGGYAWYVTARGAWAIASGKARALPPIPEAAQRKQIKVVAASDHTLYATVAGPTGDGSGIWRFNNAAWTKLPREGELNAGGFATYMDGRDRLWVGYEKGHAVLHTTDGAQMLSSGEPGLGYIYAFLDTARGLFAAGTNGLAVLRGSRFQMLTFAEPAFARGVRGLVEARNGDLWLNAASGLTYVPVKELQTALSQPTYPMVARLIREGDQAGATQRFLGYLDTAARDSEGRLWFATVNGVVHVDPIRATASIPLPIISLRATTADGEAIGDNPFVMPGTRTLALQYFGLNLTSPERVIYRYRLEGFDRSWQEAGRRTEAIYTRLAPGDYTFSVMASNGDGVWSAPVSLRTFTVLPSFYQRWWFAALVVVFLVLIVAIAHFARVRQLSRLMTARFDERLAERTRVARELHDTLLQTIHGSKLVADHALRDTTDRHQLVRALEQLSTWLSQASAEGREALQSLRASTTERNDLAGGLQRAFDECRTNSASDMSLSVQGQAREMHPMVRDEVYRIGFEAIRNACVHSHASRIDAVLEYAQDLTLRVSDNGEGIDAAVIDHGREGHFGLRGMRERAERIGARFSLVSNPGKGTIITLIVPGRIIFRAV